MAANREPKHLIEGFSDDLKTIAQVFATNYPHIRLIDFLSFWNDEHLDCLLANRFDPRELIEAISEMNLHLTEVLVSPDEDVIKIIAIYLLLCIYIKQPERFQCKFRWTCQDLIKIENWCNTMALDRNNSDPQQALKQLKALRAFDLVEERTIYGPSMIRSGTRDHSERTNQITSPLVIELRETREFLETSIEPSVSELRGIHANYDHFRQILQLANYQELDQPASTNTSPGVYLDQAANSIAEFKSTLDR